MSTTPATPHSIAAAGSYRVVFEPDGAARLGSRPVPLTLDGLWVDAQRRLTLAELPVWPGLPASVGLPVTRAGAMAFWRGQVYYSARDGLSVNVRDCHGGVGRFVEARHHATSQPGPDLVSLAATPRDTLLVVDRGSATVSEHDLLTTQSVWSWGGLGGVDDITVAPSGEAYVTCDRGVVRLDAYAGTTDIYRARRVGSAPASLAWAREGDAEVLFVTRGARVLVIGIATGAGRRPVVRFPIPGNLLLPVAIRWHDGRLYLGSPSGRAIEVVQTATASRLGALPGSAQAFAAFGLDREGSLWIGDGECPVPAGEARPVDRGSARLGPMPIGLDYATGHTLRVRLVGQVGADATVAPEFSPTAGDARDGPADDVLADVPGDATEVTVRIEVAGPASTAPGNQRQTVSAVELRVDEPAWIEHLPAIYREPDAHPEQLLDPLLRLLRTRLDDVVDTLLALPSEIDPATAIDDLDGDRWLDWLSGWVDVQLDETMKADLRRALVAGAFARHGKRGTAESLRELIALELDLEHVEIAQPGDVASVWVLGADSAELGMRTMTAAAPPTGSIVDSTAVAGASHLIGPSDYGAPLFGDLAHRFDVLVHAAWVRCEDERDRLAALIERERPAHASAHLCVIEPGISVGIQARIGVDTVIGVNGPQDAVGGLDGFRSSRSDDRLVLAADGEPLVLK
ncbi:phage tail protein [Nocardioides sp. GCM10028917]|uniref:phage tail protein n=1 Tax=Nocardioides sp. GCM10028917 TaxID=3273408 RepID=UPI00360C06A9